MRVNEILLRRAIYWIFRDRKNLQQIVVRREYLKPFADWLYARIHGHTVIANPLNEIVLRDILSQYDWYMRTNHFAHHDRG